MNMLFPVTANEKDIVFTPEWVAKDMISFFKPSGRKEKNRDGSCRTRPTATASLRGEFMTNEDEKIVADYMGWKWSEYGGDYYYIPKNGKVIYFDLNDAGLVVAEMQKRGEFIPFVNSVCYSRLTDYIRINFIAWLFNADNFFKAFTEWRKGIKLDPVIDKESAAYMDN
jgi:hypothetical protein